MKKYTRATELFNKLLELMDTLRNENGCPWDREQTRISLKPYIMEETCEVLDAIDSGKPDQIREELGDLFFQIVFQTRIGQENDEFDMSDVLQNIHDKMIRRHPHVFGNTRVRNSEDVIHNWEQIKKSEPGHPEQKSVIGGLPSRLPALMKAQRLQEKAATVGFDWNNPNDILDKIEEEMTELKSAMRKNDRQHVQEELGDLLFAVVNLCRYLKFNADDTLKKTNDKFVERFENMEKISAQKGRHISSLSLDEMESLWQKSKTKKRKRKTS